MLSNGNLEPVAGELNSEETKRLISLPLRFVVTSDYPSKQQPPGTMLWLWQGASSFLSLLKGPRPHICGGRLYMSTKEEQLPPEEAKG